MESSNPNMNGNTKLRVTFPKSTEDHRLQLVEINGSIFAIVHSPLESLGPIRLLCEEWSLILLAPIKSKTNILISAINVICLNEVASEEGIVNIHASNRLVKFAQGTKDPQKVCEMGEGGEFEFNDDPGAFLFYYRLFTSIVNSLRTENTDLFSEAQQKFITSLCTLADKIEANAENLDLNKVLQIWNVPPLKQDEVSDSS
jgi:hypothetical protein